MPEQIRFSCPSCGVTLGAAPTATGQERKCPKCKAPLAVPDSVPSIDVAGRSSASATAGRKPSKIAMPWMIAGVLLVAVLAGVLYGVLNRDQGGSGLASITGIGSSLRSTPEQQAVRAWLTENLDEPEWEEVRWWPARDMVEFTDKDIKAAQDLLEHEERHVAMAREKLAEAIEVAKSPPEVDEFGRRLGAQWYADQVPAQERSLKERIDRYNLRLKQLNEAKQAKPLRVIRLKYRSNWFGSKWIRTDMFAIVDGKATKIGPENWYEIWDDGEQYFPE